MIKAFIERFNTLSQREKIFSLLTLLMVAWGLWDKFIYQPVTTEQKLLNSELSTIESNISANQQAATQIEALGKTDLNKKNKQSLKQVKEKLKKLKLQLNTGQKKFVPAHLMTEVLQDMLKQNHEVKLVNLETLPVTTLTEIKQEKSWVYLHGLSITLRGNYFSTLKYLESLESSPWQFHWGAINYQVKEYPSAETKIDIYTLSFEENWLGL